MSAAAAAAEDLDALFDQIAAETATATASASIAVVSSATPLADETTAKAVPADAFASFPTEDSATASAANDAAQNPDVYQRVGELTRTLHDALRELGYDRSIEAAVQKLPDARDRLNYIAALTGQAAERALSAVERGQAVQQKVADDAARLGAAWEKLHAGALSPEEFKQLAGDTRNFMASLPAQAAETRAQLHEIMMAQDFHDLTGQMINRVMLLAQSLETQLLTLLVEARPAERRAAGENEWLTGPAINAAARSDVVAGQAQVDELLESLGF